MPPRLPAALPLRVLEKPCTSPSPSCASASSPFFIQSASASRVASKLTRSDRFRVRRWLETRGTRMVKNKPGSFAGREPLTPFPTNKSYKVKSVLADTTREFIWNRVAQDGDAIKVVSAEMGIDMRRVAAVVRLKEIEKRWLDEGTPLAHQYNAAITGLLEQHRPPLEKGPTPAPFEPINEIHVHGYTMQQLFVPVSESRHFTRRDAAAAFHPNMLPADERVPHREIIARERRVLEGAAPGDSHRVYIEEATASESRDAQRFAEEAKREEARMRRVQGERAEFRFQDINVDDAGANGRSRNGVGWRYGTPLDDRKRKIKIPTKVE